MPFSTQYFKQQTRDYIISRFSNDIRILDVGAGAGAYFDMLSPLGYTNINCVEAFEDYIVNYNLKEKYNIVYNEDVTKLDIDFNSYDLVILGDVLEHIELNEAKKLLEKITTNVIVGVPFLSPQGEHFNNKFEIHLQDDLTFINFFERFNNFLPLCLRWDYGIFVKGENDTIFTETQQNPIPDDCLTYIKDNFANFKLKDIDEKEDIPAIDTNTTIVTGLWNINRSGRSFDTYLTHLDNFLKTPQKLFIYVPHELEEYVRSRRDESNTYIKVTPLDDIKDLYRPFWDRTQTIRKDNDWLSQATWLPDSPQASLEWYNPIVQSKMFLLNNASIWNPFDTDYFFWVDAGITNTVPCGYFTDSNVLHKLHKHGNPFLFLSYPYEANTEIHGFNYDKINEYSNAKVEYVCRGGLFGGHKNQLHKANATYYSLLDRSLSEGLMGTEESLFTIMSYLEPDIYRRYELDDNGLIVKFTHALYEDSVTLVEPPISKIANPKEYTDKDVNSLTTNLYMLTFNFPDQILHTIESMKKTPEWLTVPNLYLLDNSTDADAKTRNQLIAKEHNFEYIDLGGNTGICGGRQAAAEHFHNSNADFMFFFEDDMTVNPPELEGQFCRNGFRKYVPNIYNLVHRIMLKENFDFLKLSFTEVYFDNDKQCSWYNVPQSVRTKFWPEYDQLPVSGLDPNVPKTSFNNINNLDGLTYIDGEVYYANWPMIVSKEGNKKMFIDTTWAHPYEQTWMSHMYQQTKTGELRPAILLASPIWHDRIMHYKPEERREN